MEFEFEPHTFVGDNRFISAEDLNKYDAQVKGVNTVNNNDLIVTPSATFTLPTTQVVTVDAQVNFPIMKSIKSPAPEPLCGNSVPEEVSLNRTK